MNAAEQALHDAMVKAFSDEGKLIEAGFAAMRTAVIAPNASEGQLSDMRMAFMAGAQHLFSCLLTVLDSDATPTDDDMRRMSLIDAELRAFADELTLRLMRTQGSA